MVTATRVEGNNERSTFSFKGLAADTKPIGTWEGAIIENGSSFLEIDTQNVVFFDRENQTWPIPS